MATVDVVIPVYNEEHVLAQSIATLRQFLKDNLSHQWQVVIADNASIDRTWEVAQALAAEYPDVAALHLDEKGRGRALRRAWLESTADIVSYMDVDLSTELAAFPAMVSAICDEGYDIATGSRLMRSSQVERSPKREFTSRGYNLLIKAMFWTRFSDAQCGFKAITSRAARELIPLIKDQEWFFDTELLILGEKKGYRIKDIPVAWVEDPDSRVDISKTVRDDIRGLLRLRFHRIP
ncbi:MAG: dolichyl-phosphate beta-glucosyltransferase [Chloroflexota bacterium]|nr:dolichyl-phosphate beta-glucosyltransferase [Chloroflexota bacterium]